MVGYWDGIRAGELSVESGPFTLDGGEITNVTISIETDVITLTHIVLYIKKGGWKINRIQIPLISGELLEDCSAEIERLEQMMESLINNVTLSYEEFHEMINILEINLELSNTEIMTFVEGMITEFEFRFEELEMMVETLTNELELTQQEIDDIWIIINALLNDNENPIDLSAANTLLLILILLLLVSLVIIALFSYKRRW